MRALLLLLAFTGCVTTPSQVTSSEFTHISTPDRVAVYPTHQLTEDVIILNGAITEELLPGIPPFIKAARDTKLKGGTKMSLVVNGPGGFKHVGDKLIKAINYAKALGLEVECIVPSMAASMDFLILQACSTRYAVAGAYLMFHPMRLVDPRTGESPTLSPREEASLREGNIKVMKSLCSSITPQDIGKCAQVIEAFYAEKGWTAQELADFSPGWITVIQGVDGPGKVYLINFL